jgi:hypothetical protein
MLFLLYKMQGGTSYTTYAHTFRHSLAYAFSCLYTKGAIGEDEERI